MPTADSTIVDQQIDTALVGNKTGSPDHLLNQLMVFAAGAPFNANPFEKLDVIVEEVFRPAFSSPFAEKPGDGNSSTLIVDVCDEQQLEEFKKCASFFTDMARVSDA